MKALRLFVTALVAFALGACGGGGEMVARIGGGGSGAPPTTDVGVGGVEGFGSIIINGQHYDETAGQFQVDERPDQPSVISVDAVRLGMQMQFESQSNRISKAHGRRGGHWTRQLGDGNGPRRAGPDGAHQRRCGEFRPAFDGFTALSDLATGAVVEVHGQRNAAGEVLATRIELRAAQRRAARRRHRLPTLPRQVPHRRVDRAGRTGGDRADRADARQRAAGCGVERPGTRQAAN